MVKTKSLRSDPTKYEGEVKKVQVEPKVFIWSEMFRSQVPHSQKKGTVVLIPGTADDTVCCWKRAMIDRLMAEGLDVLRLDNRGYVRH